jgi:predicted dithiol-disulfide oxidoreductase (DUF899 family)
MGWTLPWYSSFGSDFNYDFHGTLDQAVAPVEYNYRNRTRPPGGLGAAIRTQRWSPDGLASPPRQV